MRRLAGLLVMLSTVVFAGAVPARAQNQQKWAATDIRQIDEDFAFQGEYLGYARTAENGRWRSGSVGLQVIALGDGKFNAVLYSGGLPGGGWNRADKQQLSGRREGNRLRLEKGPLKIDVYGSWANIFYPGYSAFSRIEKIFRVSRTVGQRPPLEAIVLFDGTGTELFNTGRMTDDGLLMEGADTRDAYQNFTLHVEFRLPYMPHARGQGRSNSGLYLQSRYEVQILDSFGLEGKHNECGGVYKQRPPDLNMCYPPLRWQTYDVTFMSAQFDATGRKTGNARLTVWHNGELIHNDIELTNKTGGGRPEGPEALPTKLQNHNNPVRFRNIWLVEYDGTPPGGDNRLPIRLARQPRDLQGDAPGTADYVRRLAYFGGFPGAIGFRGTPRTRNAGIHHLYPRPSYQQYQTVYNPVSRQYVPVDYYSPVPPDHRGYWTW